MRKQYLKIIPIFIALCFCLSVQLQIHAQKNIQPNQTRENAEHLNYQYIISKLTFTSRISKSTEQINEELIKEISERKVDFVLTSKDEEELKNAGASDLLIKTIEKNLLKNVEKRLNEEEKYFEEVQSVYKKFTDNYRGNLEQKKIALEAAKEFIEKFGNDKAFKSQTDYLKRIIQKLDNFDPPKPHPSRLNYEKFNQALKDKKWNDLFEVGEKILKNEPEFVDLTIVLASVGYDKIAKKNPKNENLTKTIYFAEKAIDLLKTKKSESGNYGFYDYAYKTKEFPDGKANALSWMNYIIGYIKYFHLNEKEAALPYFRKSLEYKSEVKKFVETMPISKN